MKDTVETGVAGPPASAPARLSGRWLLLFHQLPPEPSYVRVKARRQLQRIGAFALKNSVYVLPNRAECLEDFQWLRRSILDDGGEATVVVADLVEGTSDHQIEEEFRREAQREYAELRRTLRKYDGSDRDLRRLRAQLEDAKGRDWFGAPGRADVERALEGVDSKRARPSGSASDSASDRPRGATWVTRRDVFVDRMASAWLILGYIDPAARFKFVDDDYKPARGELRFDMFDGEFTHVGDRCTFETLLARFGLATPALDRLARIVHDIDFKIDTSDSAEAESLRFLLRGICLSRPRDEDRIDASRPIFDSLLANFEHE